MPNAFVKQQQRRIMCVALCVATATVACASASHDMQGSDAAVSGDTEVVADSQSEAGESADSELADQTEETSMAAPSVEIGVPGGPDGLDFMPLAPGAEVRLQSFGQGGTHVLLGVRCVGFGNRAYVGLTLTNQLTAAQVSSPPPLRPQLLLCREPAVCDLVPILAMASGLTAPGAERNGLAVRITVDVRNDQGLSATASQDIVLSTADL
jgi:hypothetical protein